MPHFKGQIVQLRPGEKGALEEIHREPFEVEALNKGAAMALAKLTFSQSPAHQHGDYLSVTDVAEFTPDVSEPEPENRVLDVDEIELPEAETP